jgi:8-hydroxy-5-deazaflavin:NADPH oxidoreductase
MRIRVFGRGPLAEPIVRLAERAGHLVRWCEQIPVEPYNDEMLDLVILAGSRSGVEADLANVSSESLQSLIVVDAITPTQSESDGSSSETAGADAEWIATMFPEARIVRAFASVPAQAFSDLLNRTSSDGATKLAVPFAGDDHDAKAVVATFIGEIGFEPFDLGGSSTRKVLDPGGPLWGKAMSEVEMVEAVGWLAGDG